MALFGLIPDPPTSDVTLKLTPEEATREATGKALSLVGATIGAVGTIMALSTNPAIKSQTTGVMSKLPKSVQDNRVGLIVLAGLVGAGALYMLIRNSTAKQAAARYK